MSSNFFFFFFSSAACALMLDKSAQLPKSVKAYILSGLRQTLLPYLISIHFHILNLLFIFLLLCTLLMTSGRSTTGKPSLCRSSLEPFAGQGFARVSNPDCNCQFQEKVIQVGQRTSSVVAFYTQSRWQSEGNVNATNESCSRAVFNNKLPEVSKDEHSIAAQHAEYLRH